MNSILKQISGLNSSGNFRMKVEEMTLTAVSSSSAAAASDSVSYTEGGGWFPIAFEIVSLTADQDLTNSQMNSYDNTSVNILCSSNEASVYFEYQPRVPTSSGGTYPSTGTATIRVLFINWEDLGGVLQEKYHVRKRLFKSNFTVV